MAFPIQTIDKHLGVLMVDSREEIRWTEQDHAIGSTISALAADGVLAFKSGSRDSQPEARLLIELLHELGEESALYTTKPSSTQRVEGNKEESHG